MKFVHQTYSALALFLRPSEKPDTLKLTLFVGAALLSYISMLYTLALVWYAQEESAAFHWFDDSMEWRLCDKLGHAYIAFIECRIANNLFRWCGLRHQRSLLYSFILAFTFQSGYEVLDGFAAAYGASIYDIIANALGALLVVIQFYLFKKIIASFKFNFFLSEYAVLRPGLLGDNLLTRCIKDYNGQTYWISINVQDLLRSTLLPKWLMLSIGYGGDGLVGGHDNIW
ncbi:MAG TPA: DUF2279 domain-containing protein, partial [Cytophagales bacterium]|nr:DUF2279 domain-containing protein [Cytophagales bacterium]